MAVNPILSIHDQGAGGVADVVKEIVYPNGAYINLNYLTLWRPLCGIRNMVF